ncbi:hypothetical protein [Actinophytocola oryzae]|uniref:Excreted virulence factor EspC (Type VII ESX diderm) n=1 Tax=Actinophytocola oryzae TaxID=502181 RepID=A0A4R7UTD0_9PSEU|nr:hypothetical protein [Actinophytocola oryzae]TDV37621.1 hypothetical protein CLV71_12984 [Actinophytocola oryzae]
MTGIKLDPTWLGGYAKLSADSAAALAEGVRTMNVDPLTEESFGSLGDQLGTPDAYGKAARLLRGQLARAVEALTATADGLTKVTEVYVDADETSVRTINREQR